MTLDAKDAKVLRAALRGRRKADLKRAFALIRAHEDRALLAAVAPARKRAKRGSDALLRELEQTLKPILGPAQEKADLLVEHIARKHRRKLAIEARGLADAARQLRARFSDDQIAGAARSLVTHLAKLHGDRETVV